MNQRVQGFTDKGKMMTNYFCLALGLIPLALVSLLSRAFAPFEGLCPLDIFHLTAHPSPESLAMWRWGSAVVGVSLLILGVFKRPFGAVFLALETLSGILFLYRLVNAMGW